MGLMLKGESVYHPLGRRQTILVCNSFKPENSRNVLEILTKIGIHRSSYCKLATNEAG